MYQNRRQRDLMLDEYVDEQVAQWRWDSHLFTSDRGGQPMHCVWCGWQPPTEMPLNHAALCMDNPVIKTLINDHTRTLAAQVREALLEACTDVKGGA
jgi:hypothetical protein